MLCVTHVVLVTVILRHRRAPDGSIQAGEYGAHGRCEYVQKRTFSKARRYEMQIRRGNLATPLVVEVDGIAKAGVQVEEAC
jgi:hypothetical protein